MLPIQRRFTSLFSAGEWTPLVPVEQLDVYASLWSAGELKLWTLVNRSQREIVGAVLRVPADSAMRYFDLVTGKELQIISGNLEALISARGIGGLLALPANEMTPDFEKFLASQASTHARASYDSTPLKRKPRLQSVTRTTSYPEPPPGMIAAQRGYSTDLLRIQMRVRECGFYDASAIEELAFRDSYFYQTREFVRPHNYQPFAIDETPVTNSQYSEFLAASNYRPSDPENFLKHWTNGQPPAAKLDHPVVWVDLADSRAYAEWAGKRLPTEDEWQYAAQHGRGREYPLGNGLRANVCNLGETGDTTPVKAFPEGRSSTGVYDFCGNVWQWTESEATEGRTRYCMIRGGSHFAAQGSLWYVDGGPRQASFTTKFLMMWPGLDRCATIGFRCMVDLETTENS